MTEQAARLLFVAALLTAAPGTASSCPSCLVREEARSLSLGTIKHQILARLRMSGPPNVTGFQVPRVPPLEHIFERMQADQPLVQDTDDVDTTLEKVIAFAQPQPRLRHWRSLELLSFKFSDKMQESRVVKCWLWLYAHPAPPNSAPLTINLYRVSALEPPLIVLDRTVKEARGEGAQGRWIALDVKRLVSEWLKAPGDMLGLGLHVDTPDPGTSVDRLIITASSTTPPSDSSSSASVPFLELHVTDSKKHRSKRTIGLTCQENSEETRCCRYPLTVDFEEFGWDWIIAPKKYEANYCSGECPYVFLTKYPHTHIVQLANPAGTAGPCCAPRKMSSISMLYFDQDLNINYEVLPGMVVDRCGCS